MAIIYNGSTVPTTGNIKYNGTNLNKVIYRSSPTANGVTVWQKAIVPTLQTGATSFTYYYNSNTATGSAENNVYAKQITHSGWWGDSTPVIVTDSLTWLSSHSASYTGHIQSSTEAVQQMQYTYLRTDNNLNIVMQYQTYDSGGGGSIGSKRELSLGTFYIAATGINGRTGAIGTATFNLYLRTRFNGSTSFGDASTFNLGSFSATVAVYNDNTIYFSSITPVSPSTATNKIAASYKWSLFEEYYIGDVSWSI